MPTLWTSTVSMTYKPCENPNFRVSGWFKEHLVSACRKYYQQKNVSTVSTAPLNHNACLKFRREVGHEPFCNYTQNRCG